MSPYMICWYHIRNNITPIAVNKAKAWKRGAKVLFFRDMEGWNISVYEDICSDLIWRWYMLTGLITNAVNKVIDGFVCQELYFNGILVVTHINGHIKIHCPIVCKERLDYMDMEVS